MRILIVMMQLESGGAQTVSVDLHREFVRRGILSKLVFLYEKDPAAFPQRDYETMCTRRPGSPLAFLKLLRDFRRTWAAFRPTAVISQSHFGNNICAIVKLTGVRGAILAVHQVDLEQYPKIVHRLDAAARRLRLYASEVSVSAPVAASMPPVRPGDAPRPIILNSQNLARSTMGKAEARASFGFPADAFLVGNIGRLAEQKNQAFLIDLLAAAPDLHVAILGEGPLRAQLTAQAAARGVEDRLTLVGAVVRERVPDFLAALDLFVLPSLREGLSLAMLEAMGAGVPFIGNDVPTIAEVVHGGLGGAGLVLPLDLGRWHAEIARLRAEPDARVALGRRERERAADFSVEKMADHYLAAAESAER